MKMLSLCLAAMSLFIGTCYGAEAMPAGTQNAHQWNSAQGANSNMTNYDQGQKQDYTNDGHVDNSAESGYYGQEVCCGKPFEHACGDTYQLYCTYKPCYYNEWRTVCEPQTYQKKCCKYVAKEYDKCCVKYVPQYYTQKCSKYEPSYYYTTETREVSRKVCDRKCKYIPQYYYKHIGTQAAQACPAPKAGCAQ